jgi:hypothetical protein
VVIVSVISAMHHIVIQCYASEAAVCAPDQLTEIHDILKRIHVA